MIHRRYIFCLLSLVLIPYSLYAEQNKILNGIKRATRDSIYMGTMLKIDIASPIVTPATNKWHIQHYEAAVNVRLAKRFYPTIELGYAGGETDQGDTIHYAGQGGFIRLGCDLNPLKKHPESPHALLVGIRVGTAVQQIAQENDKVAAPTYRGVRADCWGEVVAGCQVEIAKVNNTAFYMGWMGRFKILFTRFDTSDRVLSLGIPVYVPGYGKRDNIGWGLSYHLGWRF